MGEDQRPGPEGLELGAQLVGERDPRFDELLAGPRQCPERPRLVAVRADRAQPMGVGSRQLGEHERIEAVGLAVGDRVALPRRLRLVGMHGDHGHACLQESVDEDPIGALDRHPLHIESDQFAAERGDSRLLVGDYSLPQARPGLVDHAEGVLLAGPVDPCDVRHRSSLGPLPSTPSRPRGTVARAHWLALSGATPCWRFGCLAPSGGAGLTRAVYAASVLGALPAVVGSMR